MANERRAGAELHAQGRDYGDRHRSDGCDWAKRQGRARQVSLSRDDIAAFHSRRPSPTDRLMYRIRIVDASDDDIADTLADLHRLTFFDAALLSQFELGGVVACLSRR